MVVESMTEPLDDARGELLVCPFCGKPPAVEMTGFHLGARTIYCADNDCMGPSTTAQNMDDATIQWNTRPAPVPQCEAEPGWREALEKIVEAWDKFEREDLQLNEGVEQAINAARTVLATPPCRSDAEITGLPKPETMLTYASILEKPQYWIDPKTGKKYLLATGEIIEAACAALRYCAALSPDPGTVAVASGPTAEDIRACARSTLIGFQHELGDSIDFICDQIARKATMPAISSTHHHTPAE